MKKFRVTADRLTSCTYEVEAETEAEARRVVEDEEDEITPYFVEPVTSPIVINITELQCP